MTLYVGQQFTITWDVIAADGNGPVTMLIDPTGLQNFQTATNVPLTGATPTTVGTYTFTGTTPALTCAGTGNTCVVQLSSSTDWFSCATVSILTAGKNQTTASPTLPQICSIAKGLTFCTWMNNQQVVVPPGVLSPIQLDWLVQATYNSYLANPLVFTTPTNPQCAGWFQKLLCGINFQPCNQFYGTGGCNQACVNTNNFCSVTQLHSTLYNCTKISNTGSDLTGNCSGAGTIKVSAVVMIVSALLSVLVYML